jgi:hypothetical protein
MAASAAIAAVPSSALISGTLVDGGQAAPTQANDACADATNAADAIASFFILFS